MAVTEVGVFYWTHLFTPDYYNNEYGSYSVVFHFKDEDGSFRKAVDAKMQEVTQLANLVKTQGQRIKILPNPIKESDEVGGYQAKFKTRASFDSNSQDSTKVIKSLPVYDASGTLYTSKIYVGNGSTGRLAYEITHHCKPDKGFACVSLRLNAVQLISVVSSEDRPQTQDMGTKETFESFGFSAESPAVGSVDYSSREVDHILEALPF